MLSEQFHSVPRHIGIIPDGNRRWADARGLPKQDGYAHGLPAALLLVDDCLQLGVAELTFYGFTQDNTKRAAVQREAFQRACIQVPELLRDRDVELLVVGNTESGMFPEPLRRFTQPIRYGRGRMRVNLLVNYSWQWDLDCALATQRGPLTVNDRHLAGLGSAAISRIDLVLRWGGRCRLSGFLPIQTVYADVHVIDALWPDYATEHLRAALDWYQTQDVTLGG